VAAVGARFVNRPLGSGTRVLLDELLDEAGVASEAIAGYARDEPSHTAVAQAVAAGSADVGLGIELAARARGLDFVPLVHERYHLACLKASLEQPATRALRALLQTPQWLQRMEELPGYAPLHCGEVLAMSSVLPWWRFARAKRPSASSKKP
jgi:molybdate-binding protein